jgi:hypothetical protein
MPMTSGGQGSSAMARRRCSKPKPHRRSHSAWPGTTLPHSRSHPIQRRWFWKSAADCSGGVAWQWPRSSVWTSRACGLTARISRMASRVASISFSSASQNRRSSAGVRVPEAVQRREARRGQRLVDGRPVAHPGIAARHRGRVRRQARREVVLDQAGAGGPLPWWHSVRMGLSPGAPSRAGARRSTRTRAWSRHRRAPWFPQRRIADRAHAGAGEQGQVLDALVVAAARGLVEPGVADPVDGAFMAAPQLEGGVGREVAVMCRDGACSIGMAAMVVAGWPSGL